MKRNLIAWLLILCTALLLLTGCSPKTAQTVEGFTEVRSSNYNYYAFTADGNFHMIARIGNTMLYCESEKENKDDIVEMVKKLGYK